MRTTSDNSIGKNMALAMALWPNATWTEQLQDLWRERLVGLNQDIVADAIKLVKPQFSSHQPELKWVLSKCAELHEQRMPRVFSGNQRPTFWHASWTQASRHGPWPVRYGIWCDSQEHAYACIPAGCIGTVTSSDHKDDPYTREQARQEEDEARLWLASMQRDRIVELVTRLRKIGFFADKTLPARIGDWSRMEAMMVYAAHVLNRKDGGE
jgi:hypothetical protein